MSDDHNIDRLFQESFKDFEVDAPKGAWNNIEKKLNQNNKKRIVPLWQKVSGVAAVIAIIILAGSQWFITPKGNNSFVDSSGEETINQQNLQNNPINYNLRNSNSQNTDSNAVVNSDDLENISIQEEKVSGNSAQNNSTALNITTNANQYSKNNKLSSGLISNSNTVNPSKPVASTTKTKNYTALISILKSKAQIQNSHLNLKADPISTKSNKFNQQNLKSLVKVAEQINNEKLIPNKQQEKTWFVKPQISPVFYGNLGSGSAVDQNFNQNPGQSEVNVSYGLNLAYKLNNKIKIRTGVNQVNFNYNTNDVFLLSSSGFSSFNNVDVVSGFESSVVTSDQLSSIQESLGQGRIPSDESQLQQQLGFIEIPMELEYKLIDKTIDVNIIGGASTLLLNDNSLDIQTGNTTTFLGEANNINAFSFSTNFAIGLDYDISERLILNLEPTFKYQFNTFQSATTDFQPFFIGVYSGVVFKF